MERVDEIVSARPLVATHLANASQLAARFCFGATVVLIPFRMRAVLLAQSVEPVYRDYTDVLVFASDLFLLATLAPWSISLLAQPRRVKTGPLFLSIPMVGLTALAALSVISSVDPLISLDHVVRLVLLAAFYLYTLNEVVFDDLVVPVALMVTIQAIVGIAQVLQQHSLGLTNMQELELNPAWSGVSIVLADGVRSLRAYGLTDHPNILGGCLAFGLLVIGAWYASAKTRRDAIVAAVFALGAVALLVTFSRSAWIAFAGGFVFCIIVFLKTRQREPIARWLSLVSAALILLLPFIWNDLPFLGVRLNANDAFAQVTLENRSITERDNLAQATFQIWSEHPLFGVGVGALPEAQRIRYPNRDDFGADYQPAHFVLLDVAAETGVFGALFYLVAMVAPWFALWWNRKRLTFSSALIGISGVLLAVTLVGFFDYYTWLLAPGQLWQWLVWGAWGAVYSKYLIG